MKKNYAVLFVLFICAVNAQTINFTDPYFKEALLNHTPAIDTNGDGEIQVSEANAVTHIELLMGSSDISEISYFPNLTFLKVDTFQNGSLDLSMLMQLEHLELLYNFSLNSLNVAGPQLKYLDVTRCNLSSIDLSSSTNTLEHLSLDYNNFQGTIDFSGFPNLKHFSYANMYVIANLTGMTQLEYLDCNSTNQNVLDLTGFTNLKHLNCGWNHVAALDVSGLTSLEYLNCEVNAEITALNIANLTNLTYLNTAGCFQIGSLDVANLTNLTYLNTAGCYQIGSLDVAGLVQLEVLNCISCQLPTLEVSNLTNLTRLECRGNQLTTLDIAPLVNLTYLDCAYNNLSTLAITPLVNLTHLFCNNNSLTSLDLTNASALLELWCNGNQFSTIDISHSPMLTRFKCSNNQLSAINVTTAPLLETFECSNNQLTSLDLSNATNLQYFSGTNNLYTTLDFSAMASGFGMIDFSDNPLLTYVNLKTISVNLPMIEVDIANGINCPSLSYVCANDDYVLYIHQQLQQGANPATNVTVNSYCSFVPAGPYNLISANVTFDNTNNGCDASDAHFPGVKMIFSDGITEGMTFTNNLGSANFPVQTGSFTITPVMENPYFNVTPAAATLTFNTVDESTQTQNFCITPNGIHNDLEVSVIPTDPARPGFDAHYIITYKNKGNQPMSGTVSLAFDDSILDFVGSTPATTTTAPNLLTWDFTALEPFQTRTLAMTMNLNSPVETPAVNNDDHLFYTASITANNDETPDDNLYTLDQTVVGSFDPNDKTCLEGNTITPEMVGDYLHYLIRFQNSGTFYAENVVVKDIIDTSKFDMATLQLTGSSHPHATRITGNKVEFIFEGINLPAEQDDEPGSHGFVAFKIKTLPNLVLNDVVENTADIFFDFNAPIVTNTTSTTVSNLGLGDADNIKVSMTPNPVRNSLTISTEDYIQSVQVFDLQGRLLHIGVENDTQAAIDFSEKTTGVYLVKVTTAKGMKTQKIIKE